jgi:hypothetical protein
MNTSPALGLITELDELPLCFNRNYSSNPNQAENDKCSIAGKHSTVSQMILLTKRSSETSHTSGLVSWLMVKDTLSRRNEPMHWSSPSY